MRAGDGVCLTERQQTFDLKVERETFQMQINQIGCNGRPCGSVHSMQFPARSGHGPGPNPFLQLQLLALARILYATQVTDWAQGLTVAKRTVNPDSCSQQLWCFLSLCLRGFSHERRGQQLPP